MNTFAELRSITYGYDNYKTLLSPWELDFIKSDRNSVGYPFSAKQEQCALKIIAKLQGNTREVQEPDAIEADTSLIFRMVDRAKTFRLTRINFRINETRRLKFDHSSDSFKLWSEGSRKPLAKISRNNSILCKDASLIDAVLELLCDPIAYALKYSSLHNTCMFCGLSLDDPKSVGKGYGPICAKHYGLPWGSKDDYNLFKREVIHNE